MHRLTSERGAVLMHVILAVFMLIGINVFVIDYGVMWVGRNQAQNSADAGAFAGAIALAYDNIADRTDTGPAKVFARQAAQENWVGGQAPKVNITTDVTFPTNVMNPGPTGPVDMCAGNPTPCVRVDVYRDAVSGNPLPSLFGSAVGVTGSGVKAMAIAKWGVANSSACLKPWALLDKWLDNNDTTAPIDNAWTDDDTFDPTGPNPDVYVEPTANDPGTGFTLAADLGVKVTLKAGKPNEALAPGVFGPIQLPLSTGGYSNGGAQYRSLISGCNSVGVSIGDSVPVETGNMIGPTKQGVDDLIALDDKATWDSTNKVVKNSCAQAATPCAAFSPRIVAIPIVSTAAYYSGSKQNGGNVSFKIVNILGFFIDKMQGNDVVGYITSVPGLYTSGGPVVSNTAGFAKIIMLVR
jgi:Flp pilus assembly protein TadG